MHAHAYSRITKGPSTITLIMSKAFPVSRDTSVRLGILCVMWVHDPGKKAFWGPSGAFGSKIIPLFKTAAVQADGQVQSGESDTRSS